MGGVQAFHHPIKDSFSREQRNLKRKQKKAKDNDKDRGDEDFQTRIAIKCGDGKWSFPTVIPDSGTSYGVIQLLSSRWPELTKSHGNVSETGASPSSKVQRNLLKLRDTEQDFVFKPGCLSADLFDLCYSVSDVPGEWGEFSRCLEVSPRFLIRNDSIKHPIKVKQTGAPESTSLALQPGEAIPFYWADFRLPRLVSVLPVAEGGVYKWSGGFDLCNLGMTPVRIRNDKAANEISSIRALVEVRPGTGGFGINVSFREEESNGDGSLFRIENLTPFPIWLAQDGVLANPNTSIRDQRGRAGRDGEDASPSPDDVARIDGDLVPPQNKSTFALDVPYMQGKYLNRKEATMSELLHVRVALAPLSSRAGIETVKVIGLTTVGDMIRLNPSRLPLSLTDEAKEQLQLIRILGVVATDGPTRVLKFW
jgi:SHR-binding domain of vacuolar-sorting associated protein 13